MHMGDPVRLASDTTVKRRRRELGLCGSGKTTRTTPKENCTQAVLSQVDKDPARHQGIRTIQQRIAFDQGIHLTRCVILSLSVYYDD